MLSVGIVGLPNVGKSTLFNALTKSKQADAQNYPFCTIEPNVGVVEVPDKRLPRLVECSNSQKSIPTAIEFVDIAGLVKGASEGEGLGNKFLSHIREVDAIAQVVRSFDNGDITHVENRVDPVEDANIINLELILADWQTVSKRLDAVKSKMKGGRGKEFQIELDVLERLNEAFDKGVAARDLEYTDDEKIVLKQLCLITSKPMMYVVNLDDNQLKSRARPVIEEGKVHVYISVKTEAELSELDDEEAMMFMEELGVTESGLDRMIKAGYELLELVTFFTSGEQESRAWTVKKGTSAPNAAGVIHTDFIKGFIKADVTKSEDFIELGGWNKLKGTAKQRLEGKDYIVQDGDVIYFHVAT